MIMAFTRNTAIMIEKLATIPKRFVDRCMRELLFRLSKL